MNARTPLLCLIALFAGCVLSCKPAPVELVEAKYTDLKYADGIFMLEERPFTGRALQYHGNGQIKADWEMRDGLNHGVATEFTETGQQVSETNFVDGKHHGDNRYWDADGNLIKHQIYDMDKEVSVEFFGSLAAPE